MLTQRVLTTHASSSCFIFCFASEFKRRWLSACNVAAAAASPGASASPYVNARFWPRGPSNDRPMVSLIILIANCSPNSSASNRWPRMDSTYIYIYKSARAKNRYISYWMDVLIALYICIYIYIVHHWYIIEWNISNLYLWSISFHLVIIASRSTLTCHHPIGCARP